MTTYRIPAPDGTEYEIEGTPGATRDQVIEQVKPQWEADQKKARETAGAQQLGMGMAGTAGGTLTGTGLADFAKGAFRDAARTIGGIDETVLEGIGWGAHLLGFPETSAEAFRRSRAVIPGVTRKAEELAGKPTGSIEEQVGGILGGVAPSLALPGGPIVQGAISGATQPLEGGTEENLVSRLVGGVLGGATGGASRLMGSGIGKYLNMKEIEETIKGVVDQARELDPTLTATKKLTLRELERLQVRHQALTDEALRQGDTIGPIDTSGVRPTVGRALSSVFDKKGVDRAAMDLLKETNDGLQATRDGGARYSQLRVMQDNLARYLKENADSKNPAMAAVRAAKEAIDARLDEAAGPEVKALEKKAQRFYSKNIEERYGNDTVRSIMEETDPNKRAEAITNVALGTDKEAASKLADLLGKNGNEGVNRAMMKKALDSATSDEGVIDPVKFVRFFDDKPGFTPFKMDRFDEMVKGFGKFIKSEDLLRGESRLPSLPKPRGVAGSVGAALGATMLGEAIWNRLASGHFTQAATMLAGSVGSALTYKYVDSLLTDSFGRHLLIAMSRVPEGSPRWMRLVAQAKSRFGGALAGQAAGQGAATLMGTQPQPAAPGP